MSTINREIIRVKDAPAPIGPFSPAVRVNDTIYLSGAIGQDKNGEVVQGGIEAQAHQALKNIGEVLEAAGISYGNVVKCTVLLANMGDFGKLNEVYKQYFKDKFPARACYQVAALPRGALVEIEAVAVAGQIKDVEMKS